MLLRVRGCFGGAPGCSSSRCTHARLSLCEAGGKAPATRTGVGFEGKGAAAGVTMWAWPDTGLPCLHALMGVHKRAACCAPSSFPQSPPLPHHHFAPARKRTPLAPRRLCRRVLSARSRRVMRDADAVSGGLWRLQGPLLCLPIASPVKGLLSSSVRASCTLAPSASARS